MAVLIDSETTILVQGITGAQGGLHTPLMIEYGSKIVAGTSPGKGGATVHGVPVYDTVREARDNQPAEVSIIFVPAQFAADAALEALDSGIKTVVVITENIPVRDTIEVVSYAKQVGATIIGPNTPGVISPGKCKIGILPTQEFTPGKIGVASRSGTLTYEIAEVLSKAGLGQSTCIGLGGDPVTGLNFIDALELFKDDIETDAVVLIGEIGGNLEELAASYIERTEYPKPVVAYIAGRSAPAGKRMGHAGAIIMGNSGTALSKISTFEAAKVKVAEKPSDVAKLLFQAMRGK